MQDRTHSIVSDEALEKVNEKGRRPDFKGKGVSAWLNYDKNKKQYLSIVMNGSSKVWRAFQYPYTKKEGDRDGSMHSG